MVVLIAAGGGVWWLRCRNVSPVERGRRVAMKAGCFNCHGDGGLQGIANPGAEEQEVPAWVGGTQMMYIHEKSEEDLREWILYGYPKRKEHDDAFQANRKRMLIKMPAYEGKMCCGQLEDLVAYFRAASGMEEPPKDTPEHEGFEEAREHGCFGCHGPGGKSTPGNPSSLTGYIPSWDGSDFDELVKDDAELETWIREGTSLRLEKNPVAKFFLSRQTIKMPAYKDVLDEGDIQSIKAYIGWLRSGRKR